MENEELYSTEEIANVIGLKGSRTRQLLNELVAMGIVECTVATQNGRYVKKEMTKILRIMRVNVCS